MHCSDCLWFQHGICIMQFDWEEPVTEDTDICCEFDKKFNQKRKTHNELNNTLNSTDGGVMNCDNCKYYEWYYDRCRKWDCEVDAREVHNCFEQRETPVRDAMANSGQIT